MITLLQEKHRRLWGGITAVMLGSCLLVSPGLAQSRPDAAPAPTSLNSAARLMAGLPPSYAQHMDIAATKSWQAHSAEMQAKWARIRDGQAAAVVAWREAALPKGCPVGKTLLYPFSGPDFLNAHWLFPDCETLVLFGLEHVGDVPDVGAMNERQLAGMLADARGAMTDLFARNYFITDKMSRQLRTSQLRGVVPVLMISMALSGLDVVAVAPHELTPAAAAPRDAAAPKRRAQRQLRGVTIEYRAPGSPLTRRLHYFSVDVADRGLADHPEFVDYLRGLAPSTTLLKSASYLLHGNEFRQLRGVVFDVSAFLVQDDTGLPYAALLDRGWQMRLYGRYQVPIPPFEYAFQPALANAYRIQNPDPLPFFFGYHRNQGENRSTVIVGRKPLTLASDTPAPDASARATAPTGR